jgi:hypothetical protein
MMSAAENPAMFKVFFTVIPVFIGVVFVFVVYSLVRNWRVMKARGVDPITAQAEIAARMAKGKIVEGPSIEERLAELDDLRSRGIISDTEHADGRRRILGG